MRAPPSSTTSASLKVNGNNPAQWPLNTAWQDNLGALFTHAGQSETIYSTSTVDTTTAGTTTLDYWALIPSSNEYLHATRAVVLPGASNDNPQPQGAEQSSYEDNSPIVPLAATDTDATSTAQ